jgi:hypothetical protein
MRTALSIALTALLTACLTKVPAMTPEETKRIKQVTARPSTRCVGRYLIDLPEAFVMNSESKGAEVDGVKIVDVRPMNKAQFELALADREADLRKEHIIGEQTSSLDAVHPLPGNTGVVFDRSESGELAAYRTLELHGWKDGYSIEMRINSRDLTKAKRLYSGETRDTDTPQKLAHLLKVYHRVRGRSNDQIPTEQGLCFPFGFVVGPAIEGEVGGYLFDLKNSPDVYFRFTENGNLHEETTLLQRSGQVEGEMNASGTRTIRKGKREIYKLPYEEWLMHGPTPDRVPGTMFTLLGNEVAKGADKPFVKLLMHNGFRVIQPHNLTDKQKEKLGLYSSLERATLSETEALAIWDKVSATLRPRAGAF